MHKTEAAVLACERDRQRQFLDALGSQFSILRKVDVIDPLTSNRSMLISISDVERASRKH